MPYIAINQSNDYDHNNKTRYATFEQADTRAREILAQFPSAQVCVVQVLQEYKATVDITANDPEEVPVEAATEESVE